MADVITTKRLVLRSARAADGDVVIAGLNDYEVVKWLARPPYPFTRADLRLTNDDGSTRWPDMAVIDCDGSMIGMISGVPHLGFWLLQRAWGQGYATEAGRGMIDRVFTTRDVDALDSGYFEGNAGSAKVLAKLGFRETGRGMKMCVARKRELPHVELSLTREDWETAA